MQDSSSLLLSYTAICIYLELDHQQKIMIWSVTYDHCIARVRSFPNSFLRQLIRVDTSYNTHLCSRRSTCSNQTQNWVATSCWLPVADIRSYCKVVRSTSNSSGYCNWQKKKDKNSPKVVIDRDLCLLGNSSTKTLSSGRALLKKPLKVVNTHPRSLPTSTENFLGM
jgi:hypothetical protein